MQEENDLSDWQARSKAVRRELARQSRAAAAEAEEEQGARGQPAVRWGESVSFRGKGGKPRWGWAARSRALPASLLQGAGDAQDFSKGMGLQGGGLEWKAINGVRIATRRKSEEAFNTMVN